MARSTKSVDSLSIQITADAQSASQALNVLIRDIGNLANAINGMNMSNITTQMRNFGNAVNSVNSQNLVQNVTRLTNATARYNTAINRATRTTVSSNSGFNSFSNSAYRAYSSLDRFNSKLNSFASRIKTANKETKNFAQTVGLLYARFFLLIRGVKLLTKQVKSSMDYIEILNYFDSSMGQVAERGVSKWAEMGYDSAEAYYSSFSQRAKEVTSDMSGFFPESNGNLTATNRVSLGMNPQELLQYQSQFAQMSSSMGTTSEQALKLSEVMTKLGADLASVKNLDFNEVWTNLSSGLVGMSRTMDRYGVNIRSANMQQKLMELGINANVSALSQADKALLRTIIILDSTKYAWADLAETLNTPANQFRMLTNNIKLLGQMIGNILLPVVAKILPYLNAFVIALQRLFTWLARVLGIDLSGLMANNATPDNSALSDMLDDAEGLGDALGNDADEAKKLKKQLQGFDALNNLTSKDDSTTGALDGLKLSGLLDQAFNDAVEDYLKAWQDAFDKLENKAKAIADKISNFFISLFAPIRRAWAKVGDDLVTSWKRAFTEIKKLVDSFMVSFWRVWGESKTQAIFENIFGIVADIGDIVGNLAEKFREAWDEDLNGYHILSAIRDIILTIVEGFHSMTTSVKEWTGELNFAPLLSKFSQFLEQFNVVVGELMTILKSFLDNVLLPLGKWTIEEGLPTLFETLKNALKKIDWEKLKKNLNKLFNALRPFGKRLGNGLIKFIDEASTAIAKFVNGKFFSTLIDLITKFVDSLTEDDISNILWTIVNAFVGFKLAMGAFKLATGVLTTISFLKDFVAVAGTVGRAIGKAVASTKLFGATFGALGKAISNTVISLGGTGAGGLAGIFEFLSMDVGALVSSGSIATIGATIGAGLAGSILASFAGFKIGNKIGQLLFPEDEEIYENFKWTGEGGFFDSAKYFFTDIVPSWFSGLAEKITNFNNDVKDKVEELKKALIEKIFGLALSIEEKLQGIKDWISLNVTPLATLLGITDGSYDTSDVANAVTDMANALTDGQDEMKQAGSFLAIGLSNGFKSESDSTLINTVKGVGKLLKGAFCSELGINSPSKVFYSYGQYILEGLDNGMNSRSSDSSKIIDILATNITKPFNNTSVAFNKIGANLMIGLSNGINSYSSSILAKVTNIANSVTNSFRRVWQIHSPSRVMDDMGVYFMEGLQNGIESMYNPIENSVSKFGNELAQAPKFEEQLGVEGATAKVSSTSTQTFNADNSETNTLLRQQNNLLQAILEKETGINAGDLFKSVQNSATSYYKMTGNKAFA